VILINTICFSTAMPVTDRQYRPDASRFPFPLQVISFPIGFEERRTVMQKRNWDFFHSKASDASWTPGLREIFEYRDLGYKDATKGDYVAHIVRANGKEMSDEVQEWHRHVCDFQFVYVLDGWAEFEYAGHGVHRIEKGDCIQQTPLIPHREIACSKDFAVLEIVSPANFKTEIVDAPEASGAAD
jgi:uncharacterized protein YjlB